MSSFRDKLQIFLLGLMLGLLLGGGFFILKLDNYFKELSFYKSHDEQESREDDKEQKQAQNNPAPVKKKITGKTTAGSTDAPSDSLITENNGDNASSADTLAADTSLTVMDRVVTGDDEIVVRKDEMLASRTVELINLNFTANAGKKDSVQAGMDPKVSYKVEYWKSPINYKGYKMTRNKLVLYGISSGDPISIFRLDDDIYLKHLNAIYRLVFTNDFRQFEKVSDPSVLSKLGK